MQHGVLRQLAADAGLERDPALQLAFGLACVERVRHLLEEPRALALLDALRGAVQAGAAVPPALAAEAAAVARGHRGSPSLDGSGHSAVSATHALARALAGHALEAADYAAYAAVYAYGRYAVQDPASFEPEHAWQADCLRRLVQARQAA
ncbi:hypothetical protein GON04_13285 [Ramlibacter sp. MAH-25]|uniref:Uncharacterized protein n=1 Tax=Ramlibacter pinisoli TaxID=2682844 RepID=A0A6N8IUC9_9BURK|nr:hypothetical protein [Ramlibacter sp. CGMCC 1.13660]MVQ30428.1 hypothetical protein [Ramlibacter pinisoli]